MLTEILAWGTLCLLAAPPPVYSFGMLGPRAEHERITRVALACPSKKTTGDCFEPLSIDQLAGKDGFVGGVGSPDAGENLVAAAHCDDADYLDHAKYGIPGTYSRSRSEATVALQECIAHVSSRFLKGVADANRLLDGKDNIMKRETDLGIAGLSPCDFRGPPSGGFSGRAKCNAIEGLGRALHGVQDFYTHSNWVDEHDPSQPISRTNPPGLRMSGPSPLLNLRSAMSPAALAVPPELATGCFILRLSDQPDLSGEPACIEQGRITHVTLNKDEGDISVVPGVSIPPVSPLTSNPLTPRGRIARNFENAVQAAIADTRRQWGDFRAELVSRFGPKRASRMICALVKDKPWKDCTGRKIALVIDSSGSNKETDPSGLRIAAAQAFAATLVTEASAGPDNQPDLVTVIDFDTSARVVYPLGDPVSVSFDGIDSSGGTLIGSGVVLGMEQITEGSTEPNQDNAGIVVLTDGQDSNFAVLAGALDLAFQYGIRVNFGFLSPPANPVPVANPVPNARRLRARALYPRQIEPTAPPTELLEAVLKTGGVFSTIDSAEAQQSFIELIIARGATNIDGVGSNIGGPLFQGVTVYGLGSAARGPATFTYHATAGKHLTFEIQTITGPALKAVLYDIRGSRELGNAVTDDKGKATILYEATADVDLQLTISAAADAGDSTGVYSVKLLVTPPDNGTDGSGTCNTPNGSPCEPLGDRECCGTGFLICDHGGTVFLNCGPGTVCRSDNGTSVYCGWP
jgi:hypothetical protein